MKAVLDIIGAEIEFLAYDWNCVNNPDHFLWPLGGSAARNLAPPIRRWEDSKQLIMVVFESGCSETAPVNQNGGFEDRHIPSMSESRSAVGSLAGHRV